MSFLRSGTNNTQKMNMKVTAMAATGSDSLLHNNSDIYLLSWDIDGPLVLANKKWNIYVWCLPWLHDSERGPSRAWLV